MTQNHYCAIIIPGLGDNDSRLRWATTSWASRGIDPLFFPVGWRDNEIHFQPKLERLLAYIDTQPKNYTTISLIGTSAGGSVAINAFCERKNTIHRAVNVYGRLRMWAQKGFRSYAARTASSPSFAEAVTQCELNVKKLRARDLKKIMTVRAQFGDELVPADTTTIPGCRNITLPTFEHVFSIALAMSILSRPIIQFLLEED